MKKILACEGTLVSACKLRDAIEELTGKHYLVSKEAARIGIDGVLIRYGNSFPVRNDCPDTPFNPSEFISMTTHKRIFSDKMVELGVLSPIFHFNGEPEQFPVLIRSTLTGSGGEGIKPARNRDEFRNNFQPRDCWTTYFNVAYEVRAYVVGGNITHCYYKVPFASQEGQDIKIRSEYHFSYDNPEGKYRKLRRSIDKIIEASRGKFFSVDAGWLPDKNEYVIFEANSGSWINEAICGPLATYLVQQLALAN